MVKKKYLGKKENNKGFGKTLWCAGCECARRGRWAWLSPGLSHGGRVTSAWCPRLGISASWSVRVKRVVGKRPPHSPHAGCAAGAGLPRRASRVAPSGWTAARLPPGPCGGPSGVDLGEMRAGTCSWERSSPQTWFSQHLDEGASSREYGESNSLS